MITEKNESIEFQIRRQFSIFHFQLSIATCRYNLVI